jgi:hypothetical protein
MSKKLLTVKIESILVNVNGEVPGAKPDKTNQRNVLTATLLYPRSGAPSVASAKQFDLQPGKSPDRLDQADFFSCGLFKEEVNDETILEIAVTDRDIASNFEKGFVQVFSAILGAGLTAATAGTGQILGAITGLALKAITGGVKNAGADSSVTIGQTDKVRLKMDDLAEAPTRMTLGFTVPALIEKNFFAPGPTGDPVEQRMRIEAGSANGTITLLVSATPA